MITGLPYDSIQSIPADSLIGNSTNAESVGAAITLGTGLFFSGSTIVVGGVPNSSLNNSGITINGHALSLGGSLSLAFSDLFIAADLNVGNFKITNLGTPTLSTDAATKAYVDSKAGTTYSAGSGLNLTGTVFSIPSGAVTNAMLVNSKVTISGNDLSLGGSLALAKGDVGLGNVENTALSTWAGSANIVTLGTITTGVWNGTSITNANLANSSLTVSAGTGLSGGGTVSLGGTITLSLGTISTLSQITTYNSLTTAGQGLAPIVAYGRVVAVSAAATSSICSVTAPASDSSYRVSANVNVTTLGSGSFTIQVAYIDENNNSKTATLYFIRAGATTPSTTINNPDAYQSFPLHIRVKASTTITIKTSNTTFTGCTYNAEGIIEQLS